MRRLKAGRLPRSGSTTQTSHAAFACRPMNPASVAADIALVEHVAADDQVEAAAGDGAGDALVGIVGIDRRGPVAVQVLHRHEAVQAQVVAEEAGGQRMAVARRDVGAAPVARPGWRAPGRSRSRGSSRPESPAAAPAARRAARPRATASRTAASRRRDAEPLGGAVGVGELLAIEQRADDEVVDAGDRDPFLLGPIAWHRAARARRTGAAPVEATPEYARVRLATPSRFVRVRGAREHNLKNVDVDIPRDALVVFSGVSGSGKSSLAFGTLYAEAQRRYFESVAPYARRLIDQVGVPDVDSIEGLPPAVALQQQRGTPSARSSVGSVTTLSSLLRMLYSRAGSYPPRQPMLYAEDFSPNTPQGACPNCHGLGRVYEVTEKSMVPGRLADASASARSPPGRRRGTGRTCATSWSRWATTSTRRGATCRRRTATGSSSPTSSRRCRCIAGFTPAETRTALRRKTEPSYMGTFTGARKLRAAHLRDHAERADEEARLALHGRQRLPGVRRQAAEARGAVGDLRRASTSARCRSCR